MKVHYPKLYNMAHLLALNVLLLPKDLTIIFIYCQEQCLSLTTVFFFFFVFFSVERPDKYSKV